jgi:hypothetical protein
MKNSYAEGIAVGVEKAVGVAILRRRQFYTDGQFRRLPGPWSTPTAPTFGRRCRHWPSAYCAIPVVMLSSVHGLHCIFFKSGSYFSKRDET